ncbi:MAG: hypothetical protein JW983_09305 [Elusimicrobia bacterium]|nr:hypothetical protein [Elusimicrobiota bacterium]
MKKFVTAVLFVALSGMCFANWDDPKEWDTGEKNPESKISLESFKGENGDGIKVSYDLMGEGHNYAIMKKIYHGEYDKSIPFVFKIKAESESTLELKIIDKDGSIFIKTMSMKDKFKKFEEVVVYLDTLDYGWGGDNKFDEVDSFCIGISGKKSKGTVWLDEIGFGKEGMAPSFKMGRQVYESHYGKLAEKAPFGYYPRWLVKEQSFWTVAGVDYDDEEMLFSEEGIIEPFFHAFSIQPFLYIGNEFISYGQAKVSQSMEKGYIPVYTVTWEKDGIIFEQKLFASGDAGKSGGYLRYRLKNKNNKSAKGRLFLAFRPFQVNPPWQYGGFADITNIEYSFKDSAKVIINDSTALVSFDNPDGFGAIKFKDGDIVDIIKSGNLPKDKKLTDPYNSASGALAYGFNLASGETKEYFFYIPIHKESRHEKIPSGGTAKNLFEQELDKSVKYWEARINKAEFIIPEPEISNVVKSNIAYILINRDKALIQPGSRNYQRSYMRDGAILGLSMLSLGYTEEVKEYIEFTMTKIGEDGFVPFMVEVDKLPDFAKDWIEYDSQGEFVYIVMEYYRFTRDKKFLKKCLPAVKKALEYMVMVRNKRMTPEYKDGPDDMKKFYGILPESNSHEGYFPGVHSYWDDFWAVKGWKDANEMAKILKDKEFERWTAREGEDFKKTFYDSMKLVMKINNLDYIPACAEKGDYDPTSTSIGIYPCGEIENLPKAQLKTTFDRYYDNTFLPKLQPGWKGHYTPYEQRNALSFLIMGKKQRVLRMFRYFMTQTRPKDWNHLGEVVYSVYRNPEYIGDMPHTWIGGEIVNTARMMLAREHEEKIILGEVIDPAWLKSPGGTGVKNLHTYWGVLNYNAKQEQDTVKLNVSGTANPPAGFVFKSPFIDKKIKSVKLNGKSWKSFTGTEVSFKDVPAEIIISY